MNNLINIISPRLRGLLFSLALLVLLMSCMDDEDDNLVTESVKIAHVSVYHASPDAPQFDIVVDNRTINTNPFDYASYSGYLNFFTGNRNIKFNAVNASNALIDTTFNFEDGKAYSLFAIDQLSKLEALLVMDSAGVPAAGNAMVRFVQLSPDAPVFDLSISGDSEGPLFEDASFKDATQFVEIAAKTYTFNVNNSGLSDAVLSAKEINIHPGGYYTIITRGFANPPAGNTNILSVEVID